MKMRLFFIAGSIIFLLFILSPFMSLFYPCEYADHAYRKLLYKVVTDKQTRGAKSKEEIVLRLFDYTYNHIFLPKNISPYEGKAIDYLILGIGWCDYEAKVLDALLAAKNIPGRYAMLRDKDGVSPHTVTEVYLNNRWAVFDPLERDYFKLDNGEYATLNDLSKKPQIIFDRVKDKYPAVSGNSDFESKKEWYRRMFPLPMEPVRSKPATSRVNIFDKVIRLYADIFGESFTNAYQDNYLKIKLPFFEQADYRIFFAARNYQLFNRYDLAIGAYKSLMRDFPKSSYVDNSLFFLALLYIDNGDYKKAEAVLDNLFTGYPESEWVDVAHSIIKKYKTEGS